MLVFSTKLGLVEFQARYLALFLLFSVIGGFGWFWMGNLHKNIQLMLEFLNCPFLVLIYPRFSIEFGMLVFFTNLGLMEFQARYLALLLLFSVIGGFGWFWMGNLHKNIQLMLEFLKCPFVVLHFSYYTLMTFLMMLAVILLSMLMILLSNLNVIRHLICGNN